MGGSTGSFSTKRVYWLDPTAGSAQGCHSLHDGLWLGLGDGLWHALGDGLWHELGGGWCHELGGGLWHGLGCELWLELQGEVRP